ncbi:MAG: cell wall hydrolase [Roseibium album]|uniref:cell wall hydrolase n=1 Tax=Roseibium album TaxID=311410 RepID=UPI0018C954B2|nr:hypothetical protein [Labrenzia sp. EL_195]
MKNKDADSIFLDEVDIDYIARVVQTEVGANWKGDVLKTGVAAIVDTILNRVAYDGPFPGSVSGVVNQKNAFTKINGPKSYYNSKLKKRVSLNPYGGVQNAPKAGAQIDRLVRQTIAERAAGGESTVGPSLHYANPHPAYSGDNARGPDGWVWKIAQDPYLVTGSGKYHSHVHGTDPNMRPLADAPEIKFVPSKENGKVSIDELHHVFTAPDGLDRVAPPIPAAKGTSARPDTKRVELLERIARKPLSFKDFYDRTEAKLAFQRDLYGGRENHVGGPSQDIYDFARVGSGRHHAPTGYIGNVSSTSDPSPNPSHADSAGSSVGDRLEKSGRIKIPVPPKKPDRRASAFPSGFNPFDLENPDLERQAEVLERNPIRARQMILAAGRDPKLFRV